MRVILINYEYPPLGGGAGIASQALAQGLIGLGVRVDVLTAKAGDHGTQPALSSRSDDVTVYRVQSLRRGIHQSGMAGSALFLVGAAIKLSRLIRNGRYDVAHIFFSLPTGALLPVLRRYELPTVVSLRGSDVPGYDSTNRTLEMAHCVLRSFNRWIWDRSDCVVPVCRSLGMLARQTHPDLEFTVIGNGVDKRVFRPPATQRPRRPATLRCLAVSRLIPRKGLRTLLHAFWQLPPGCFSLDVVGSGMEEESLRALAKDLGLADTVRFWGAVDHADLGHFYRNADLFTLVPTQEAFGNVFAEAVATGLPVVGSDIGGVRDMVEPGENGILVHPGNPNELAGVIAYLAENPDERLRMGRRSAERARDLPTWSDIPRLYLDVYERVLAHRQECSARRRVQ